MTQHGRNLYKAAIFLAVLFAPLLLGAEEAVDMVIGWFK